MLQVRLTLTLNDNVMTRTANFIMGKVTLVVILSILPLKGIDRRKSL